MDQYIGKTLDNRYEILEQIGSGGMAVVYKARDLRLNRMVAVKILRENMMTDDEIRRRFHNEAEAVAMLSSPNIVGVYDVGEFEGADYIVMELIEGITLKEYMEKRGTRLSWQESHHFMTQIMQALRHAHSKGIVHRDIKPQNIMVLKDGSVKVADFGIARFVDQNRTITKEALGSVHYVSPEQAKGLRVDERSDIYSAGVVLYEMLTAMLPFDGDTPVSIALQHINGTPTTPRDLNPDIPIGMEQICKKAMCARLELRYPNAEAVLEDLDAIWRDPGMVFPFPDPWTGEETRGAAQSSSRKAARKPGEDETQLYRQNPAMAAQAEAEAEELEERSRIKKRNAIFTGAVVAIVAVILVILFMFYRSFLSRILSPSEVHEVPSLLNMTIDEAKETIARNYGGFFDVVCTKAQFDNQIESGRIISQSPEGGSSAKGERTEIKVIVSSGIQQEDTLYMPSLTYQDYRTAETMLKNEYGVEISYADRVYSDAIPEGQIVSTDPIAGTPLESGQTVTLYVSKGPENRKIQMPLFIGLDEDQARESAEQVGLEIGSIITVASSEPEDQVIYQSISAFSEVEPGTVIYLQVSDGSGSGDEEPETEEVPEVLPAEEDYLPAQDPTEETETSEPVYQITVPVSEDVLTADMVPEGESVTEVTVSVEVNGETVLNVSCPIDSNQVSSVYKGEINSITVLINGVQTNHFEYMEIGQ